MQKLNCIIVDDEPSAHKVLENYCRQNTELELVASCFSAEEALAFIEIHKVEVIFLDVKMPTMDGFAFIQALGYKPAVILTTAHLDTAAVAFDFEVVDFLLKPIRLERFNQAAAKAVKLFKANVLSKFVDDFIEIKHKKEIINISYSDIVYFQSVGNYVKVHTGNASYYLYCTTAEIEKKLKNKDFTRVHKSYIIRNDFIKLDNLDAINLLDTTIPIGKTYLKFLREKLSL